MTLFEWGVARTDATGALIGTCTLLNLSRAHRRAEIGFALGRASWGQGLATEALERMTTFAFDVLDLHRLEADVDPRNERSLRMLGAQGFQREGLLRVVNEGLKGDEKYIVVGQLRARPGLPVTTAAKKEG